MTDDLGISRNFLQGDKSELRESHVLAVPVAVARVFYTTAPGCCGSGACRETVNAEDHRNLKARRELLVASEGIPLLLVAAASTGAVAYYVDLRYAIAPFVLLLYLLLLFRDPGRIVPAAPLGVVSPVDGTVAEVSEIADSPLGGPAHRVRVRVNSLGTYSARSPVEGKVMERHRAPDAAATSAIPGGLWLQTDEGLDVALLFRGDRFGLVPRTFLRYGERVGQGERCAWLRLTKFADVLVPSTGRVQVRVGDKVRAGSSLIARLPHR
jgi:phosphatidylserine decarboxylase